jgi:hypothetical protein
MLDEKVVAEIKAKHGDTITGVQDPDGTVLVFRKPTRMEYLRWLSGTEKDANLAALQLSKTCLAYPNEAAFDAVNEKYPALLRRKGGFESVIINMAGIEGEVESKKL